MRLDRLTDTAHCLRLRDRRQVEAQLDDFERRFPQVFFAVYFAVLPTGYTVGEVGFWLLNHAAFGTHDVAKRNEFGIVLVVDPGTKQAGITLGYAIEAVAAKLNIEGLLKRMAGCFAHGNHGKAVSLAIAQLDRVLRSIGRPQPRCEQSVMMHAVSTDLGLKPLRHSAETDVVESGASRTVGRQS